MKENVTFTKIITEEHYFCDVCGKDTGKKTEYCEDKCVHCNKTLCDDCMKCTLPADIIRILCPEDYPK